MNLMDLVFLIYIFLIYSHPFRVVSLKKNKMLPAALFTFIWLIFGVVTLFNFWDKDTCTVCRVGHMYGHVGRKTLRGISFFFLDTRLFLIDLLTENV